MNLIKCSFLLSCLARTNENVQETEILNTDSHFNKSIVVGFCERNICRYSVASEGLFWAFGIWCIFN